MTNDEKKKVYQQLSAPFPEGAIERTTGRITGKGYDTTGIKYIYIAARMNEVLGVGCYRTQHEISLREMTTSKGRGAFDATCELTLLLGEWTNGDFQPFAEAHATGGHQSTNEADARKGAYTNAFKKAAAMFGCGQQAYMGTLDDDNVPAEENVFNPPPPPRSVEMSTPAPPNDERPPQVQRPVGPPALHSEEPPPMGASSTPASRNRLTSKQLAALWAIARKLNYQQMQFRQWVKQTQGVQPEFLDKATASTLIGQLSARASNGHSHPAGEYRAEA